MALNRFVFLSLALTFLTGCHAVYSTVPLGETPLVVSPDDWEGTWLHKDIAVTVAVLDKEKGLLEVGWVEKKQERLQFEIYKVQLRESGEWRFGNVQDPDKPKLYVWALVKNEDDQIILWLPDLQKARALVEQGRLPGYKNKKEGDVVLKELGMAQRKSIMSGEETSLLNWQQPLVFQRLHK